MGGNQTVGLVLMGFTLEVAQILRGGRTVAREIYSNLYDEFLIAAKLIEINGKELFSPIFNKRKYIIDESNKITINAKSKRVNKRESHSINITANVIKVKRGIDGNDWIRLRQREWDDI